MKIAITGASGHVGVNLTRMLVESGADVTALVHRNTAPLSGLDIARIQGDVLDPESLRDAFANVDIVYHLAAVITLRSRRAPAARRVNVEGTRNVVGTCMARGVKRLVHFSSIHAFNVNPTEGVVDEARPTDCDPAAPPYDRSKSECEAVVRKGIARSLDAVIVNPTAILGPHDYGPSHMGRVLIDLYRRRLPALVNGGFNWVDVRDVCHGAMAAADRAPTGSQYLLSGHYLSLTQLAQEAAAVTGIEAPGLTLPVWLCRLGLPFAALYSGLTRTPPRFTGASLRALTHHQHVSCDKAQRELDYRPRPIRETLEATFAWFKEQGVL